MIEHGKRRTEALTAKEQMALMEDAMSGLGEVLPGNPEKSALGKLVKRSASGGLETLFVTNADRLGSNQEEAEMAFAELRASGVRVVESEGIA